MTQAKKTASKPVKRQSGYDALLTKEPTLEMKQPRSTVAGKRLRWARMRAELTQGQLAEKAEVYLGTLARFEAGKSHPRIDDMERLALVLNVSPSWLSYGAGDWKVSP